MRPSGLPLVTFGPSGGNGIAKNLPAIVSDPVGAYPVRPAIPYGADLQQLRRLDFVDRSVSHPRENIFFQPVL